jgi:hypothetical protein
MMMVLRVEKMCQEINLVVLRGASFCLEKARLLLPLSPLPSKLSPFPAPQNVHPSSYRLRPHLSPESPALSHPSQYTPASSRTN